LTRPKFTDRSQAGKQLADLLRQGGIPPDAVVLALPRGGVPVAYEIAARLGLPFDILDVRKLGVPGHEELAMGAIGGDGFCYLANDIVTSLEIPRSEVLAAIAREQRELERRERLYHDGRARAPVEGKTVVVVDDGLATGATMRVAVAALRERRPQAIVVAVPVAPLDACEELRAAGITVVCALTPEPFFGVGAWYDDFRQIGDDEVRRLVAAAGRL
jgi:predicted phosphoribosyltransferase